jgi:hypothetical protein
LVHREYPVGEKVQATPSRHRVSFCEALAWTSRDRLAHRWRSEQDPGSTTSLLSVNGLSVAYFWPTGQLCFHKLPVRWGLYIRRTKNRSSCSAPVSPPVTFLTTGFQKTALHSDAPHLMPWGAMISHRRLFQVGNFPRYLDVSSRGKACSSRQKLTLKAARAVRIWAPRPSMDALNVARKSLTGQERCPRRWEQDRSSTIGYLRRLPPSA